jgi:hypothetical protein
LKKSQTITAGWNRHIAGNRISAEFPKPVDYREEMIPRTADVTIRDLAMKKFRKSQQFGLLELSTCSSFF